MRKVDLAEPIPIYLWLDDIEEDALNQARNLANLPFTYSHIALMPDAHFGYGMPIGGVMATEGVVVPNAVGVDIGCGMLAVQTSLAEINVEILKLIMGDIRKLVPVGFNHHKTPCAANRMPFRPYDDRDFKTYLPTVYEQYESARRQLGTLGGGNHFIEIQKGSDDHIWLMIHSGSRNLGYQVAKHYNGVAVELNERWRSSVPKEWQLAFLPTDTDEGEAYLREMEYCVQFAYNNREFMMSQVQIAVANHCPGVEFVDSINIAHNYAEMENHFGRNVMVHRKGATKAYSGFYGIIPGSQGSASYIVKGKGNPKSFKSCSHGAGRQMGRKQAQRTLSLEAEKKRLDDMGVVHGIRTVKDLDEAAGAYKDISVVMANQCDLVEVEVELKPLAVIKG